MHFLKWLTCVALRGLQFANDDRKQESETPMDFPGFGCFKKWSGFLGQLLTFEHNGTVVLSCTSNRALREYRFV